MLSLCIEILRMNGLDFKEKTNLWYRLQEMQHGYETLKIYIKTSTWSLEVCFFWALEIDDNPDCAQSANVDEIETLC